MIYTDINVGNNAQSKPLAINEKISKYYSLDDVRRLQDSWNMNHCVQSIFHEIMEVVLKKLNETSINRLSTSKSFDDTKLYHEILEVVMNLQEGIIVNVEKGTVIHKKGDYVADRYGNVKMVNGKPQTYDHDVCSEDKTTALFPTSSESKQDKVLKHIHEVVIPYDFAELCAEYKDTEDPELAREMIKKLFTDYYPIGLTDDVLDRILVWFCNAKGKALGLHPKYGCVLAMVGRGSSGKSFLAEWLQKSYAKCFHTAIVDSIEWNSLFDTFNTIWETRGLIPLNEVCSVGKADREVFKNRITAKQIRINQKHVKQYTVDNWTTLFSATNDEVLPILGLQENRRIIQVMLSNSRDKSNWISEDCAEEFFTKLWTVCPSSFDSSYGDSYDVFNKMLEESNDIISEELIDIAVAVFKQKEGFIRCGTDLVKINFLKNVFRDVAKFTNWADFYSWLLRNGVIQRESNSSNRTHFNESKWNDLKNKFGINE